MSEDLFWTSADCESFKEEAFSELKAYSSEHQCTLKQAVLRMYQPDIAQRSSKENLPGLQDVEVDVHIFDKCDAIISPAHGTPNSGTAAGHLDSTKSEDGPEIVGETKEEGRRHHSGHLGDASPLLRAPRDHLR